MYDIDRDWQLLINQVDQPCKAARSPYMPRELPFGFVKRPAEFQQIIAHLIDPGRQDPSGNTVVLEGSAGFGKTTLALDICDDDDVITAFDGGILWATLGERPSVKGQLAKLYRALKGEVPDFTDDIHAATELGNVIEGKSCLLVIDDVWSPEHLEPFRQLGNGRLTRLITTRDEGVALNSAADPVRVNVGELKPAEAERLLTSRLRDVPQDTSPFRELARRLGEWPLLLDLANGILRARQNAREPLERALVWINRSLDRQGVAALKDIGPTIELSLGMLGGDRIRCLELGIFPEDVDIPLSMVAQIWHIDDQETDEVAIRIGQLSLAKLDLGRRIIALHDALRDYYAAQLGASGTACHAKLADRWQDPARIPDGYPRRHAVWHIVQAMADPDQVVKRARQLVDLLGNDQYRAWQQRRGDLVSLNRQFAPALKYASQCADPQAPAWIAAIPYSTKPYEASLHPTLVFDLARQGKIGETVARLEVFKCDHEWKTASSLLVAWLASLLKPAEARALVDDIAGRCTGDTLAALLAWVRETPDGIPSVVTTVSGAPPEDYISLILRRAGGSEGLEGLEPLRQDAEAGRRGFLSTEDGPNLVDFASLNRKTNTAPLQSYISIHASNRYKHYRNASLWELLAPILTRVPDAAWVRERIEQVMVGALTENPIEFRDYVPLAVRAMTGADVEQYRLELIADAGRLSPDFGKNDSWSHYQRKASCLAEIYSALGNPQEAAALIDLARGLPKGFAGFRCFSALTLAEAAGVSTPVDKSLREAAFESARRLTPDSGRTLLPRCHRHCERAQRPRMAHECRRNPGAHQEICVHAGRSRVLRRMAPVGDLWISRWRGPSPEASRLLPGGSHARADCRNLRIEDRAASGGEPGHPMGTGS